MCYYGTWLNISYVINPPGNSHGSFYIFYDSLDSAVCSVLAEILFKDEQLIITAFKVRVYTDIAHASASEVPGSFISFPIQLIFTKYLCCR